jgi:hypothetical protein
MWLRTLVVGYRAEPVLDNHLHLPLSAGSIAYSILYFKTAEWERED